MMEAERNMMISIIIPVYNVEKYLKTCIDSVLNQTYSNLEVLLIDDGSTDHSGLICDSYEKQDSRVRVFHKKNGGVSSSRNFGLDKAEGEWIFFVDSDDWIAHRTVEFAVNQMSDKQDICFIGYKETDKTENLKDFEPSELIIKNIERKDFLELEFHILNRDRKAVCDRRIIKFSSPCRFYRREVLQKYRIRFLEDLVNGEDGLFNMEVFRHARNGVAIENALYYYRQRGESVTHKYSVNADKNFRRLQQYYEAFFSKEENPEAFTEILNERAIWSMGFCCMLKYCHKDNPNSYKIRRQQFLESWEKDYKKQIEQVSLKNFGLQKKILFWAIKRKSFFMVSVLCYLNSKK